MSFAFIAAPTSPRPPVRTLVPDLRVALESLDGTRRIPLDGSTGWKALAGATGLGMAPVDVVRAQVPGVPGSVVQDVRVEERPVFLPVKLTAPDRRFVTHREMEQALMGLVDPLLGEFRVVATTERTVRELTVVYTGGLEGAWGVDDAGTYWRKFGIQAVACQPFARARFDRSVEFQAGGAAGPFLGVAGGTDLPWPRALSSSAVIGSNMRVAVASEAPVFPMIELVGPMDSFSGTVALEDSSLPPYFGGTPWSVTIPAGVPSGSTFRMVTDPRARSYRLDGALAAGRIARGSTLAPFYPGVNVMNVAAPGATSATRVRISWVEMYRSLW